MAEAGGGFVTRSFERMLKEAPGKKHAALQHALRAYLDRERISAVPVPSPESIPPHDSLRAAGVTVDEDMWPVSDTEGHVVIGNAVIPVRPSTGEAAATTMTEAGKALEGSEAELVLLPLRLAFETKQAKIIEPALDCLHKLISYGHLEGEAGLSGGKNEVVLTELFNMVCKSSDDGATGTNQNVVLQVIKVLLTAVASPSYHVKVL